MTAQALLGHSSTEMSLHYSHVGMAEKRAGLDNVFSLLGYRAEKMKERVGGSEERS